MVMSSTRNGQKTLALSLTLSDQCNQPLEGQDQTLVHSPKERGIMNSRCFLLKPLTSRCHAILNNSFLSVQLEKGITCSFSNRSLCI